MFTNLKTVLYQKGISLRQYAQFLGVSEKTIQNKLNGITAVSYTHLTLPTICSV